MNAHEQFAQLHAEATLANRNGEENETWNRYSARTRYSADSGDNIKQRHEYYSKLMVEFLGESLKPKDPRRAFNDLERQVIYWRDDGNCQVCDSSVDWAEANIHHIEEHQAGGPTVISNGVLVHANCHPVGQAAIDFRNHYLQQVSAP